MMVDHLGSGVRAIGPFRLRPSFSKRVWGRRDLRPWYDLSEVSEAIGESWLTGPESVIETGPLAGTTLAEAVQQHPKAIVGVKSEDGRPAEFPLLIKFLFPNEKLSVQVHPNDAQAQAMGEPRGKTECWYVLAAEPGAEIALGLKPGVGRAEVEASVANNSMEQLLEMVPVATGEMVFVDAGTIHAIGPGVTILETQQTSDITYRMYDYGRPRELHLQQGLDVMQAKTRAGKVTPVERDGYTRLIEEQYFTVDRYDLAPETPAELPGWSVGSLVALDGRGTVQHEGGEEVAISVGQAVVLPMGCAVTVTPGAHGLSFAHCFASPAE